MLIEPKELSLEEMRFIAKKSNNFYSVAELSALQKTNLFIFSEDFGFVRIENPRNNNFAWVHGSFWGSGVFRYFNVFKDIEFLIKNYFNVGHVLCQIPLNCESLHRLLFRIGFHVDFNYQRFADDNTLVYSKHIGG